MIYSNKEFAEKVYDIWTKIQDLSREMMYAQIDGNLKMRELVSIVENEIDISEFALRNAYTLLTMEEEKDGQ